MIVESPPTIADNLTVISSEIETTDFPSLEKFTAVTVR